MDHQAVLDATRRWIASMVIELNLCPFARRVFEAGMIRYVVSAAQDESTLLRDLAAEFKTLVSFPIAEVETTLLIHPHVLGDFPAYNEFLDAAERLLAEHGLRGTLQIASFHPRYQFEGADADAAENYTNRSPFPMLHLLREASIAAVAGDPDELLEIPRRNIETLQRLGTKAVREKLQAIASKSPEKAAPHKFGHIESNG